VVITGLTSPDAAFGGRCKPGGMDSWGLVVQTVVRDVQHRIV
jgi:hypothetical protein